MAEKFWQDDTGEFPCKNCQERHLACHQDCERYKKAHQEHLAKKRKKSDEAKMERVWYTVRRKNYPSEKSEINPDRREW